MTRKSEEEWKDIKGYEGLYLISNYGKILSLYRFKENGKGGYYQYTKKLTKTMTTTGYEKIELTKDQKTKSIKVHRLVAKHFCPNPYNYNIVNHLDGNPLNNYYENLEWCRQVDNIQHAYDTNLRPTFEIDKKSLEHLYINRNMSMADIGELFDVTAPTIKIKLDEYDIGKEVVTKYQIEPDWLKEQISIGRPNKDIAKELGCDPSLISHYKTRLKEEGKIYG